MGGRGSRSMSGGGGGSSGVTIQTGLANGTAIPAGVQIVSDASMVSDNEKLATMDVQVANATQSAPNVDYTSMTDDDFADYLSDVRDLDIPRHLNDDAFNRFTYKANVNGKPQIVADDSAVRQIAKQNGNPVLYRTVNAVYDSQRDVGFSAPDIANQTLNSRLQRSGNGIYGQGFYFANDKSDSTAYGRSRNNVNKTCYMTATLNANAHAVGYSTISRMLSREMSSGSALGKRLKKLDSQSALSIYALKRGYNVINCGNGYWNILDRSALSVSKNFHAI